MHCFLSLALCSHSREGVGDGGRRGGGGLNSSIGSVLGSLFCVMQHYGFKEIFPVELTWDLTPFPKTLSDERINRDLVFADMHSIALTQKVLTFMSEMGECPKQNKKKRPVCTIHKDGL